MIIPIRCFTCGKLIADKWEEFNQRIEQGEEKNKILDDLGLERYCCRRMLISHVPLIKTISQFCRKS
ncbi:MAG: DNA-directed RNA polymerase subunit N [Candidatus Helarchaeota archaeon]